MNANDIITVTFTNDLTRHTEIVKNTEREYIPVLRKVVTMPAKIISSSDLGLGVFTVVCTAADEDSACCDSCGKEHAPCWRVDDSAGWLCQTCLIAQAIDDAEEEQTNAPRSAPPAAYTPDEMLSWMRRNAVMSNAPNHTIKTHPEAIEPCPYCGNSATLRTDGLGSFWIECVMALCQASGALRRSGDLAISHWNVVSADARQRRLDRRREEQESEE